MPTVPIVPPRIADLDDEREYNRINLHILRNTALGNFFDRCSISLPCHRAGEPPVGLMLVGETLGDATLFGIAAAVDKCHCEKRGDEAISIEARPLTNISSSLAQTNSRTCRVSSPSGIAQLMHDGEMICARPPG